jgi:predicted site-specific integrase-resolvase
MAWFHAGTLPFPTERTPGGHIRIIVPDSDTPVQHRVALYGRVSSSDQKSDLVRQMDRLRMFASARGYADVEAVSEIGSGLNGHRRKLLALLADPKIDVIVAEHRDRLARFGVEYIEAALSAHGRSIVFAEAGEQKLDLVQDFIDVVTSMCSRIYGRRAASNRAKAALAAIEAIP